jgi:outer membrane receptor protein involved in Fe transport
MENCMSRTIFRTLTLLAFCVVLCPTSHVFAQGVTTAEMTGVVKDAQGAVIPGATVTAVHQPSGTTYESITQGDGRFFVPGMRVGGPYKITASLTGFRTEEKDGITLSLGVAQDLTFTLTLANISETITVVGVSSPIFSSSRTGAATAVTREDLATLPTVSGRFNDVTRLAPQYGGSGSFAGQDGRYNNITVDGSYFNNSFGLPLGGQPGDRTNVAPISLEAIEQIQVSVAPFDVRQGNFVGANVNTVTRSGTNKLTASAYRRFRNESFVGTEAQGLVVNPGTFTTYNTGVWAGGPIMKDRLFAFGSFEKQDDTRPISTFRANTGGETVAGNTTRVLASDMDAISALMKAKFSYDTGPYQDIEKKTPGKPFLIKSDYNLNKSNKISFRYNQLDSSSDFLLSTSGSLGVGRNSGTTTQFLGFKSSNYSMLENFKSGIGEWNWVIGNSISNNVIAGYTTNNENRAPLEKLFPFVDILDGSGGTGAANVYTSIGSELFTPKNKLLYHTFQMQDSFTKFSTRHSLTFGASIEKYHSDNVFFPGSQSSYVYRSLSDFNADLNDYAARPNRTTSPIAPFRFQVRYANIPGQDEPLQPLDVWYTGGYAQDQWRPASNLTVTAGLRIDAPFFGDTAYTNPAADALTFRDAAGNPVKYLSGKLPDPKPLWSPRVGFNFDVLNDQSTQVRGGTGVFTGKPAYVWISNQVGNNGVITGFIQDDAPSVRPFNPDPDFYKPKNIGGSAASYELDVTVPDFKFPQTWRSNIAMDRRLPMGFIGTGEFLYSKDVNAVKYTNANLPAAQSAFTGVDKRPRWVGAGCGTGTAGPCITRINNAPGNQVTAAYVLENANDSTSWNASVSVSRPTTRGFNVRSAYSYGVSKNLIDFGTIAGGAWQGNQIVNDPNNPVLGFSQASPGHRVFVNLSYTKQYFGFGATSVSTYWEARTIGNTSYVFSGDANGDTGTSNDLIYIPRDTSEMNFVAIPASSTVKGYTPEEQAAAFEAYINQDPYLSKHRGEYAQRGALFLPFVKRMDLSLTQDVFHSLSGRRHSGQIRLDITNFSNLLNHNWGVSQRVIQPQILTSQGADANGRLSYRLALFNNQLINTTFQPTTGLSDVYQIMVSFRYGFN